jgi:glycosyltransferase involved in cell wall biosynthesis
MRRAGLETILMNYYRQIDRTKIQFDFLTHRPYQGDYDEEIRSLGGKVYYAPRLYPQNYPAYFQFMKDFFKQHPEYQMMHSHIDAMSYLPLLAGKRAGVPVRIAHSHNTAIDRDFKYVLKRYFQYKLPSVTTQFMACGVEAGNFLFPGKNVFVLPNAIDAQQFRFKRDVRERVRQQLGFRDEFVVGHVGRFSPQKNHTFLIRIFAEVARRDSQAVLLLIGTGEGQTGIRQMVQQYHLDGRVRFLGNRSDVYELYQAMDVFVLPSLYEGIPVVGIEAQFANLPCIFSDQTPEEVKFSRKSQFVPLKVTEDDWAEMILKARDDDRYADALDVKNSWYDIRNACNILEDYYLSLADEKPSEQIGKESTA